MSGQVREDEMFAFDEAAKEIDSGAWGRTKMMSEPTFDS